MILKNKKTKKCLSEGLNKKTLSRYSHIIPQSYRLKHDLVHIYIYIYIYTYVRTYVGSVRSPLIACQIKRDK